MIKQISNLIDLEVNPVLKLHAAKCELVDYEEGVITIRLLGGCSGCPSSIMVLFNMVTPILKGKFPEIQDVILEH